jgi:hypothetical protein
VILANRANLPRRFVVHFVVEVTMKMTELLGPSMFVASLSFVAGC